ncbi:MAG: PIN domain-containing protein [Peptococcaceae bacterium]|nr:PIN domain-containing protein [Peptococcaceae bacterium]
MSILALDSNIISYLLKGDENIADRIEKETGDGHEIVIPPIVYYEIKRGLLASNASKKMKIFETLCVDTIVGEIDRAVLDVAATIHADLRKAGTPLDDADILIAAYCVRNEYILITHNTKHFEVIDGLEHTD